MMLTRAAPRRSVIYTALAVAIAVLVFVGLEWTTARNGASPHVAVLVATHDIQIGERIRASLLQVVDVPRGTPLGPAPALASNLASVERSTARTPIFAGEVIQTLRLYGPGTAGTSALNGEFLHKDDALFTVPTNHLQMPLSGLAAGDSVEVLAALPTASMGAAGTATTGPLTTTVPPLDMHALVTFVASDQEALTLAVPTGEAATLHCLVAQGALFSFAEVSPATAGSGWSGLTTHRLQEHYHVHCA